MPESLNTLRDTADSEPDDGASPAWSDTRALRAGAAVREASGAAGVSGPPITMALWRPPGRAPVVSPVVSLEPPAAGVDHAEDTEHPQVALSAAATVPIRPSTDGGPIYPEGAVIHGRYRLARHISSGGFGSVYKAEDTSIAGHHVALKILHAPAKSETARESALRELRLIASVSHPSVVQFKDYGWIEGRLWFTMPWYEGFTLKQRLTELARPGERACLTRAEARPIFERLAMGLAAMHEVGIRHNDIKPDNIFVASIAGFEGGLPVLLDLGIAASEGELPAGFTPDYVAPETAAAALGDAKHPVSAPADVFSLALALRNALEPETALELKGQNTLGFLCARAFEQVPVACRRDLRFLRGDFARWLHLDPAQRPTAAEFAKELARLTLPEDRKQARLRTLRRMLPFAVVAFIVMGGLAYQVTRQREVLSEQQERLGEQVRRARVLRAEAQTNLGMLETQVAKVGEQAEELRSAIRIGRELEEQLQQAEERARALRGQLKRARGDIQELEQQRNHLVQERDQLSQQRDDLVLAQMRLRSERDGLESERLRLTEERAQLLGVRDKLAAERRSLQDANAALQRDLHHQRSSEAAAQAQLARLQRELEQEQQARRVLESQLQAQRLERERLEATRRGMRWPTTESAPASGQPVPPTDATKATQGVLPGAPSPDHDG